VTRIVALDADECGFLSLLAGLEAHSEHHVAAAIRREAAARGIAPAHVVDVSARPSAGIVGSDALGVLWAGNLHLVRDMGASVDHARLRELTDSAETVVYLGRGPTVLGAVGVADEARASSAPALAALRAGGVCRIVMMTGDRRPVALRIGALLGLAPDEIHAEMLPQDKVRHVGELAGGGTVAFVGDGVNDAAALARADVGIAMGAAGSEVALQAADVALLSEDMKKLADAQHLARRTAAIIRQNLVVAIGAMLVLVTGGLFFDLPLPLPLPLPLAVVGHEGGTVLVVLNGFRCCRIRSGGQWTGPHPSVRRRMGWRRRHRLRPRRRPTRRCRRRSRSADQQERKRVRVFSSRSRPVIPPNTHSRRRL